jgi:hypothetical protein
MGDFSEKVRQGLQLRQVTCYSPSFHEILRRTLMINLSWIPGEIILRHFKTRCCLGSHIVIYSTRAFTLIAVNGKRSGGIGVGLKAYSVSENGK